jgi:hypothetical protein
VTVPARSWAVTRAVPFASPPDPTPSDPDYKMYLLVAIAQSTDAADPFPDPTRVTDIASFIRFISRHSDSDNAGARVLRYG